MFKTANNRTGGQNGIKKIRVGVTLAPTIAMLEDHQTILVLNHDKFNAKIAKCDNGRMRLRKENTNCRPGDMQTKNYSIRKKKIIYFFNKNTLHSNLGRIPRGSRVFLKYQN